MTEKKPDQNEQEHARPVEIVSLDIGEEGGETAHLSAETTLDLMEDAQEERYEDEIERYTDDPEIQEALAARQDLKASGTEELVEDLADHTAESPDLSGGDVDAAWDQADVGEETVGGMAPTPDQDIVEGLGAALGITYDDDEPLQTEEKLRSRDQERWELDPDSQEE